jgi:3-oxoacyl-[acyl-carrier protein] reductase
LTGVGKRGQVGEALAQGFAAAGARIVAIDRTSDEVMARAAELRATGYDARGLSCDLTDESQLATIADDVRRTTGPAVHALVHAAGGFAMSGPVAESSIDVWRKQIAINLTTAYLVTRAFLPLLRAGKGAILYFSSASALPGAKIKEQSAYAVAKVGVATFMRAVADEERGTVRANALAPIAIRTAANEGAMGTDARYVEREDVVRAALYLCSSDAHAITGDLVALS